MNKILCYAMFVLGMAIFAIALLNIAGVQFVSPSPELPRDELAEQIQRIQLADRQDY